MSETCPNCGKVIVFSWTGERPPPETPLCSPIDSPDCWHLTVGREWEMIWTRRPAETAVLETRARIGKLEAELEHLRQRLEEEREGSEG
jgi:hypothetical protein